MTARLTWLILLLAAGAARAQVPECEKLSGEKKQLAESLLASSHPYDCCDKTLAECLQDRPVCALAWRLAQNICRRVAAGEQSEAIRRGLSRRENFFVGEEKPFQIDMAGLPAAGAEKAPIELVEYACARCPFCSKITPELYRAVSEGQLKGKVRLYFKTFPIRSHPHSKESGMGFLAAAEMGKFWEFLLLAYQRFDVFCPDRQVQWAEELGLDAEVFRRLLGDERLTAVLVENVKEGLRNKVDATPTFFFNGRRFSGDLTAAEIIDVSEELCDRLNAVEYRK